MIPAKYWSPTRKLMLLGAMAGGKAVKDTATGNPLTFLTDLARPLKSLLIPFTPQQEGTGDPSPSNIRPIVPWDGLTVEHGGKNLLIVNTQSKTENEVVFTVNADKSIKAVGTADGVITIDFESIFLQAGNYILSGGISNGAYLNIPGKVNAKTSETSFTVAQGGETITPRIYITNGTNVDGVFYPMIRASSIADTAYEPYKHITDTDISFPSPVYGGTLDAVTGVLSVEYGIVSLGTLTCYMPSDGMFSFDNNFIFGDRTKFVCNAYKTVVSSYWSSMANLTIMGSPTSDKIFRIRDDGYTDVNTFKEHLTEIGAVLAYPLATPQEIQLTPQQITAIVGENTIWSDADGQMTAVYFKKG